MQYTLIPMEILHCQLLKLKTSINDYGLYSPISKDTLIIGFKPLINKLEENEKIYNKITTDIYKGTICGSLISCYSE